MMKDLQLGRPAACCSIRLMAGEEDLVCGWSPFGSGGPGISALLQPMPQLGCLTGKVRGADG